MTRGSVLYPVTRWFRCEGVPRPGQAPCGVFEAPAACERCPNCLSFAVPLSDDEQRATMPARATTKGA